VIVEICNAILHGFLRTTLKVEAAIAIDSLSAAVTLGVLFAAGWMTVSRRIGGIPTVTIVALVFWLFSSLLATALVFAENVFGDASGNEGLAGLAIGSLFLLPVAVAMGVLGGVLARRLAKSAP
jgi:hypothetical protein